MTQPLDMDAVEQHLRDRLTTMYSHRGDGIPTQFVNPDGPAAVAMLDNYRARVDRLRDVLRYIMDISEDEHVAQKATDVLRAIGDPT